MIDIAVIDLATIDVESIDLADNIYIGHGDFNTDFGIDFNIT